MLSLANKPFMLSVNVLNVIMLSGIMLSVIMLSVIMLIVIMLSEIMLSAIMLNVVAPMANQTVWSGLFIVLKCVFVSIFFTLKPITTTHLHSD
jgi:hypothetical protein